MKLHFKTVGNNEDFIDLLDLDRIFNKSNIIHILHHTRSYLNQINYKTLIRWVVQLSSSQCVVNII